jgi:hypothetical protein
MRKRFMTAQVHMYTELSHPGRTLSDVEEHRHVDQSQGSSGQA